MGVFFGDGRSNLKVGVKVDRSERGAEGGEVCGGSHHPRNFLIFHLEMEYFGGFLTSEALI